MTKELSTYGVNPPQCNRRVNTQEPPVQYIAQYFWKSQMNPESLGDYRNVNLLKWNVVFDDTLAVRAWSNRGIADEQTYLVLSRNGPGIPLEEFLRKKTSPAE